MGLPKYAEGTRIWCLRFDYKCQAGMGWRISGACVVDNWRQMHWGTTVFGGFGSITVGAHKVAHLCKITYYLFYLGHCIIYFLQRKNWCEITKICLFWIRFGAPHDYDTNNPGGCVAEGHIMWGGNDDLRYYFSTYSDRFMTECEK